MDAQHSVDTSITDPITFRDAMVSSLVRAIYGPTEATPNWLGPKPVCVIGEGAEIDEQRPVGPYVDSKGQEILAVRPVYLYLTGVLWGSHKDDHLTDDGPESSLEDDEEIAPRKRSATRRNSGAQSNDDVVDHDDQDREDIADDVDQMGKRRSLGCSFRIDESCVSARIDASFATYTPMFATFGNTTHKLWRRNPHQLQCSVDLTTNSKIEESCGGVRLRIVTHVRPHPSTGSRLVTISLSNVTTAEDIANAEEAAMFQAELRVNGLRLRPYVENPVQSDSLDLLYRNVDRLAIGHGTDLAVKTTDEGHEITSVAIPIVELPVMTPDVRDSAGDPLAVGMRDLAEMNVAASETIERMISEYREWIRARRVELSTLPSSFQAIGMDNLRTCELFLAEMIEGWNLVTSNQVVSQCLKDASAAMDSQRIGATAPLRQIDLSSGSVVVEGQNPHLGKPARQSSWRPFQIAFVLASIPKIVDPHHPARSNVDVIWMPTGGGKTEAYLGLSAFTILWERRQLTLTNVASQRPSTKVIMRYTLRLLTAQQFVRCAALICALELMRAERSDVYGSSEIRIGSWVGVKSTPNKREEAVSKLNAAIDRGDDLPFTLTKCPWCGTSMGARDVDKKRILGYKVTQFFIQDKAVKRTLAYCPDTTCPFTRRDVTVNTRTIERGLPVLEVDEDVYNFPPDFVVGTVDKAAMMWEQDKAVRLFGIEGAKRLAGTRPPALLIQDELHLITGPLGSLDGLFELLFEELCSADGGNPPLIVASTATTKRFESQVRGLYNRTAKLVPPPGLDFSDSFFSVVDSTKPTRMYVGICSSSGNSNADTQSSVVASLAHFAAALREPDDSAALESSDPYWTNVCFFSSRTALGTLFSVVESDLPAVLDRIRQAGGGDSGNLREDGRRRPRRFLSNPREITATSSENVVQVLDDLSISQGVEGAIDLCFATSMIEVGLDVSRLGLMTMIGQPKSSSQYIQASGRVGRSDASPALVVDVLGTRTPRDRSHYERFTMFHRRLYASVEGASVTPFSIPALERTLPTVAAVLCRTFASTDLNRDAIAAYWPHLAQLVEARALATSGPSAQSNASKVLADLLSRTQSNRLSEYTWINRNSPDKAFLLPFGSPTPHPRTSDFWNVLTSLRSVDPDAVARPFATERGNRGKESKDSSESGDI